MSALLNTVTEPLLAASERINAGERLSVIGMREALVATKDRALRAPEVTRTLPALRQPVEVLIGNFVDEMICHPDSRQGASGEAQYARHTGEELLYGLGVTKTVASAQDVWWQTLHAYANGRLPFHNMETNFSRANRELKGTRAIDAGISMLLKDRPDLALACFEYAYNLTASYVPTAEDLELNDWISDLEPHEFPERLHFRQHLLIGTMTEVAEARAAAGFTNAAEVVAEQRLSPLGHLTADDIYRAGETLRTYRASGFARHITPRAFDR